MLGTPPIRLFPWCGPGVRQRVEPDLTWSSAGVGVECTGLDLVLNLENLAISLPATKGICGPMHEIDVFWQFYPKRSLGPFECHSVPINNPFTVQALSKPGRASCPSHFFLFESQ